MFEFSDLTFETFLNSSESADVIPVVETLPADLLTPLAVYLMLEAGEESSFLFESVEGGESLGRYSFIGAGAEYTVTGDGEQITIANSDGFEKREVPIFEFLREHFSSHRLDHDDSLPGFTGGAIAMMDFDCAQWMQPGIKRSKTNSVGQAIFSFYRSIVAFDHVKQVIRIITLVFTRECGGDKLKLASALQEAQRNNRKLRDVLERGEVNIPQNVPARAKTEPVSNWPKPDFLNAVSSVKELIYSGDAYQVVLSQCFSKETSASPVAIYRAIRSINPSPYMFLIKNSGRSVIGASPEMLVKLRGKDLEYRPIAGTRPRGKTSSEDAHLANEMLMDAKEVSEHVMLVDLGRNDLGRVAAYGTVNTNVLMDVEKYSHVQHLVSRISAELREGLDMFDALASCFPAGTVSGAPKVRAIEIINDLEPTPRGIYAGAVGYFDYAGNMDTCIAIRTLALENGTARFQAGAGIVADSVPELEYDETINKAKAMLRAIEAAEQTAI